MHLARSLLVIAGLSLGTAALADGPTPDWRQKVQEFAAEHFKHPAWGYSHSERDYRLARELAQADKVSLDDDVLFAASYLHDMGAFPPWADKQKDHADVGADIVDLILRDTGFPMQKIDAVRGAIRTHMDAREPSSGPEALYLHDADALDWLGAIGVARIIALTNADGGAPTLPQIIPMLENNLAKVPSRVFSPAGRARVEQRRAELDQFLQNLRRETDDLDTL